VTQDLATGQKARNLGGVEGCDLNAVSRVQVIDKLLTGIDRPAQLSLAWPVK
jgi:hypothetical protein